jgi:uncharacterized membrane protein YfcA
MTFWMLYAGVGVIAGFLAGLLGVGGGLIIVPVLTFIFTAQHFPETHLLHLALGTSLASIMFTSISSFRAHHGHGAVDWQIVKRITPGIITGTLVGSVIAAHLSTFFLKTFFVVFLYYVATQMLLNIKPKAAHQLPGVAGMFAAGNVIGGVSSLVGIGGGTLSVPFMTWCNVKMHNAVGTSAAIGFPIAVSGAVGYVANGLAVAGLPEYSFGFVYVPAFVGVVAASVLVAPLGAKLAHKLPVSQLKKIFAVLLYAMGTKLAFGLF